MFLSHQPQRGAPRVCRPRTAAQAGSRPDGAEGEFLLQPSFSRHGGLPLVLCCAGHEDKGPSLALQGLFIRAGAERCRWNCRSREEEAGAAGKTSRRRWHLAPIWKEEEEEEEGVSRQREQGGCC